LTSALLVMFRYAMYQGLVPIPKSRQIDQHDIVSWFWGLLWRCKNISQRNKLEVVSLFDVKHLFEFSVGFGDWCFCLFCSCHIKQILILKLKFELKFNYFI
jgi:hypothetical protein